VIVDPPVLELHLECLAGKMGPPPRARVAADVGYGFDAVPGEELEKIFESSRRMPDGPD
jgi:hypothetical protein